MRSLLPMHSLVLSLMCLLSCVHSPEPVVVPPPGPNRQMAVKFVPDKTPSADDLWICSTRNEEFWCVEYELFLKAGQEREQKEKDGTLEL